MKKIDKEKLGITLTIIGISLVFINSSLFNGFDLCYFLRLIVEFAFLISGLVFSILGHMKK